MREAVEYEFGTANGSMGSVVVGSAVVGLVMADGSVRTRVGRRAPLVRVPAPRPVRPSQAPRPVSRFPAHRPGPRVLVRCPVPSPPALALRFRIRRVVAGLLAVLVTAAVVVGLGLLADAASAARAPERSAAATSVVGGRIVTADSLTSVQEGAGQVLRVPAG